jgi:hypothetical protein
LDLLPQVPYFSSLDASPSDVKIVHAINKLHSTSPGVSGVHARLWQALSSTTPGFDFIRHYGVHFWLTKTPPAKWELGLLSILPQKGDLHNPWNFRGIIMLEIAYNIVANILHSRFKSIKESVRLDHENQNGFRWQRGCLDSIFTLKQLINKRVEHGLDA